MQEYVEGPSGTSASPEATGTDSRSARGGKHVQGKTWLLSLVPFDLEFFDHETCRTKGRGKPIRREGVSQVFGVRRRVFGIDPESVGAPQVMNPGTGLDSLHERVRLKRSVQFSDQIQHHGTD